MFVCLMSRALWGWTSEDSFLDAVAHAQDHASDELTDRVVVYPVYDAVVAPHLCSVFFEMLGNALSGLTMLVLETDSCRSCGCGC
jgi:hypothetical protein